jgi:uncharacterized iron-regulated membrane protein
MALPRWLFFVVAIWVIAFGGFRLYLAARKRRLAAAPAGEGRPDFRQRGLYALPARTHLLYGVLYLLLGGYLLAAALGYGLTLQGGCGSPDAPASLEAR